METSGWVTMVVVLTIVWGGFGLLLATAFGKESRKRPD